MTVALNKMKVTVAVIMLAVLVFVVTRPAQAVEDDHDDSAAPVLKEVSAIKHGSCMAAGLCCQSKNNTCRGVVEDDEAEDLGGGGSVEKKHIATSCFCDAACLDVGDCCDDYAQACRPVDCQLAPEWGPWSDCDARCGPGTKQRRRQVLQPALNGGAACGPTIQKIPCEGSNCKVARAPDGFHELRETGYIIPAVFGRWRKSNKLGYNPFRDIRRNIFKHYDAQNVIRRPEYCMVFELTSVRAGCNVTGTPVESAFSDHLVKGATVCVECQPSAMLRQLGTRCRGHGVARKQTRWKAVTLPGCRGRWVMKSREDDCQCNAQNPNSFILV